MIVNFSAQSIQEVPLEGAKKAFESIGLADCFTTEFQEKAELKRMELRRTIEYRVISGDDDENDVGEVVTGASFFLFLLFYSFFFIHSF